MATQANSNPTDSNRIIEDLLDSHLAAIEQAMGADCLTWIGDMDEYTVDGVKENVEAMRGGRKTRSPRLAFILETPGGYITPVERLANILRHHYRRIDFIVPGFAMSAGTVFVMAGDAIHMNYASVLGPIDPQVDRERTGRFVPALGYLEQFNALMAKSQTTQLTTAELTYLVERFDPAELYQYEHERDLSIALLEDWLARYKFKNWKTTQKRGLPVTAGMRKKRAREVAMMLNDTKRWHSHARGISMAVLRRDVNLIIDDFDADPVLGPAVHRYYKLLKDYIMRRSHFFVAVHRRGMYGGV